MQNSLKKSITIKVLCLIKRIITLKPKDYNPETGFCFYDIELRKTKNCTQSVIIRMKTDILEQNPESTSILACK